MNNEETVDLSSKQIKGPLKMNALIGMQSVGRISPHEREQFSLFSRQMIKFGLAIQKFL